MEARAWIALAVLASSCARAPTEIVLVVDTDIAGVESFHVEAIGPDMEARIASADLSAQRPPRTLVLVRRGGELGPIHLRVEARAAGEPLASVRRIVRFAPGRSLPLFVFLADGCRSASCEPRGTCGNAGECRSARVRACEHDGTCDAAVDAGVRAASPGSSDGGDDGGACALGGMCGVEARHLPGDRVAPAPCAPIEPPTRASITGPGGELTASGDPASFALGTPGTYVARVELAGDSTCAVTRELGPPAGTARRARSTCASMAAARCSSRPRTARSPSTSPAAPRPRGRSVRPTILARVASRPSAPTRPRAAPSGRVHPTRS